MTRRPNLFPRGPAATRVAPLVLLLASANVAEAAEATPWAAGSHARARLIDGGAAPAAVAPGGTLLAGLELRLDPAFITYWRDPGDAGVPPTFDFAGSTNLKAATVRYPAPRRIDEAGATAFGYEDDVTFPIVVEPADPTLPVGLRLAARYAVCHDICLPARAVLRIDLDREPSAEGSRVAEALARVPRPSTLGNAAGPLAVLAVHWDADGFTVDAKAPRAATLFVEAPEDWSYVAGAAITGTEGRVLFPVKRVDGPKGAAPPAVVLTLVAPAATASAGPTAIEVRTQLDAGPKTP